MGSLMAGWASPFQDQKTVNLERNKSLTKEEIENFHRWQKASKHQHQQQDIVGRPQSSINSPQFIFQWSRCLVDVEKACKTCDWWTQSNWAFLNEPPQEKLKSASNYAAQFHVAQFPANKCAPAN
ncbi:Dna polymerase epsilon catalytic subunit a protein [Thalictrum thalictroides]|uniref:Dna polymerase epsilon catalytic subunit a protein n=1 Tax=Thalictrum thalictroides TaxID=46969 RepID=A0A7J6WXP2_THATH|nr:Dna polymerase epsilon catalytic subunit a protein [Thalictrum thalictroides]